MSEKIMAFPPPQTPPVAAQPQPSIPDYYQFKNQLQQYTQRLKLPFPVYETKTEGPPHAPIFRSSVIVDNILYTSQNVFRNIKFAEQDVAKIALDIVMQKVKNEGSPFVCEDAIFCKAVLNEYAAKMHFNTPGYQTTQPQVGIPNFICSVVFNGVTFTGPVARSKKQAEQLAARAAILSIMDNPGPDSAIISNIVKSKYQHYTYLIKESCLINATDYVTPMVNPGEFTAGSTLDKGKEIMNSRGVVENHSMQISTIPVPSQPFHEFKRPRSPTSTRLITSQIEFVPAVYEQHLCVGTSSSNKRKKAKKSHQHIAQPVAPSVAVISDNSADKEKEVEVVGATNNLSNTEVIGNHLNHPAFIRMMIQLSHELKKSTADSPAYVPVTPSINKQIFSAGPIFQNKNRKKKKKYHRPIAQFPNHVPPPASYLPSAISQ